MQKKKRKGKRSSSWIVFVNDILRELSFIPHKSCEWFVSKQVNWADFHCLVKCDKRILSIMILQYYHTFIISNLDENNLYYLDLKIV